MIKKRCVTEWLELWGEWERCGSNYLKHLQPHSNMLAVDMVAVYEDTPPPPELNDDDARIICEQMAALKRKTPRHFRLLKQYYVLRLSTTRMAAFNKTTRDDLRLSLAKAEGYCEDFLSEFLIPEGCDA